MDFSFALVTSSGGGTVPPGSVINPAAAPIVDVTNITGVLRVGQALTGVYSFNANGGNQTNASTMQWLNGGHSDSDIQYNLALDDVGKVLTFEVTAKNGAAVTGNTDSMDTAAAPGVSGGGGGGGGGAVPPGSVIDPGAPITVQVTGEVNGYPQVGSDLLATPACLAACGPINYQWQLETAVGSGVFANIAGATSNTYTPVKGDQIHKVRVVLN